MFEQRFVQEMLAAFKPHLKEIVKETLAGESPLPLIVDYGEAGRMLGTSYEGVRKLVRTGRLTAVSRSGRYRGISVDSLRAYVARSQIHPNERTGERDRRNRTGSTMAY